MDEKQKYDHAIWLEEKNREDAQRVHNNNRESIIKSNEATVSSGSNAVRAALIINGGAAIALLSFIGGLVGDGKLTIGSQLLSVTEPLRYFAWGVALSAVSMAFGYLTNYSATGILQTKSTFGHTLFWRKLPIQNAGEVGTTAFLFAPW